MKRYILILIAGPMLIYSCGGAKHDPTKPEVTHDTLTYSNKTLKQRADDCGDKADSACTVVKITYPEFDSDTALNHLLSETLITHAPMAEKPDTTFKDLVARFMAAYAEDKNNSPRKNMFYTLQTNATVVRQDSALTTLQINSYQYTGGAHGGTNISFINWNTKTHKDLTLDDILADGYLPKLNTIAEKIFRKNENLSDTASLKRDYFFKDNKFSVNQNFLISPLGIRFLYNQYEIKPYAAGQTDLLVPYADLKGLLKPNTVTAQYSR